MKTARYVRRGQFLLSVHSRHLPAMLKPAPGPQAERLDDPVAYYVDEESVRGSFHIQGSSRTNNLRSTRRKRAHVEGMCFFSKSSIILQPYPAYSN